MQKKIWFGMLSLLLPSTLCRAAVVPSVGGQTQEEAQAVLEAANLSVGTISGKLMALIPAGIVVAQQPPTGSAVLDGSAVDLVVSLPAPSTGQIMPDSWAGRWDLTITFRHLSTNSIVAEEVTTETICPDDPFGLILLEHLADCSGAVSEDMLDARCEAQFALGECTLDVSVQFAGERTGDSLSGEGQWTTVGTGDCSGFPANQPADQGEAIELVGTRLSTDLDACGTATSSLLQKFVNGTHPSLVYQSAEVATGLDHYLFYKIREIHGKICQKGAPNEGAICTREEDCGGLTDTTDFCYRNIIPKGIRVSLHDQFEDKHFDVKRPVSLGNPANKNGEDSAAPSNPEHLKGYRIKKTRGQPEHVKQTNIHVDNQFGTLIVDTIKPDRLLLPTAKSLTGPIAELSAPNVDHFKCYRIKVTKGTPPFPKGIRASVVDQFAQPRVFELRKPTRLCTPTDKDNQDPGAENNPDHMMCYRVKLADKYCATSPFPDCRNDTDCNSGVSCIWKQDAQHRVVNIHVNNQFGPELLEAVRPRELCVPSTKTVP